MPALGAGHLVPSSFSSLRPVIELRWPSLANDFFFSSLRRNRWLGRVRPRCGVTRTFARNDVKGATSKSVRGDMERGSMTPAVQQSHLAKRGEDPVAADENDIFKLDLVEGGLASVEAFLTCGELLQMSYLGWYLRT